MARFLETLRSGRVLLMDGALGTELQRAGLADGERAETWNLTRPQEVLAVHRAYVVAGADGLLTNTFLALSPSLVRDRESSGDLDPILHEALSLARSAAGPDRFVFADVGPTLEAVDLEALAANEVLARAVRLLTRADGLLLETYSTGRAADAVRFVRQVVADSPHRATPVLLSMTYQRGPGGELTTFSGDAPEMVARLARPDALGVNCGRDIGMGEVLEIVRRYRSETDLPVFVRPNAGTPTRTEEGWVYPLTPERMAAALPELLEAGVTMVGGCCGTRPAHIAACRPLIDAWNASK
jgi:5-methyltetrahydrofolate--homocysteine methyltransferase